MSKVSKVDKKEFKNMSDAERATYIKKCKERDAELVTGVFQNLERRGGGIQFNFTFWGEDFKLYELFDGERYTIPRGVARHLNNGCFFKEYNHLKGEFGEQGTRAAVNDGRLKADKMKITKKVHRFAFTSLDFMDDDLGLHADIAEVTFNNISP